VTPAVTIYALSSGSPPAAIAVVRISGPGAGEALRTVAGRVPEARRASMATFRDPQSGEVLDKGLALYFPGPASATGEDLAELHLHGGRSVVAGVLAVLARIKGLRQATPGEFTRRAFENGRIDLAEAEGLADLLTAETESQRRAALALAGGALSRRVGVWQQRLLALGGQAEAAVDFADEDGTSDADTPIWISSASVLAEEVRSALAAPAIERLREGVRVVIAGPPNAGKSTLLNALAGREAAITSAIAGTTRDVVEAPTAIGGAPFLLIDTAGLRDSSDEIESLGIERARRNLEAADIVIWLGERAEAPDAGRSIVVRSKSDILPQDPSADLNLSARTGAGVDRLATLLIERAREVLPLEGEVAINSRHREALTLCLANLDEAAGTEDALIAAEALRQARVALDRVTGRAGVEDMLDSLFSRFCIGK
jgi:tRNA modification GTPase